MYAGYIHLNNGEEKRVSGTFDECDAWLVYYRERNMIRSADIRETTTRAAALRDSLIAAGVTAESPGTLDDDAERLATEERWT